MILQLFHAIGRYIFSKPNCKLRSKTLLIPMLIYCLFFLCFQQRLVFFQSSVDRCISQNFLSQIYPFLEESTKFSPSVYQICLIHQFSKSKADILHVFLPHHVMESAKMIHFIGGKCSNKVFIIILLLFLLFIRSSLLVFSIT